MENKSIKEIALIVMKAIALAMGVAVVVLFCLGQLEASSAIILLGIGLACAGISLLEK